MNDSKIWLQHFLEILNFSELTAHNCFSLALSIGVRLTSFKEPKSGQERKDKGMKIESTVINKAMKMKTKTIQFKSQSLTYFFDCYLSKVT